MYIYFTFPSTKHRLNVVERCECSGDVSEADAPVGVPWGSHGGPMVDGPA